MSKKPKRRQLDIMIEKHGVERGTELYNAYIAKKKYQMTVQYYIDKYGEVDRTYKISRVFR
jgi:ribosome maturation factor RimP